MIRAGIHLGITRHGIDAPMDSRRVHAGMTSLLFNFGDPAFILSLMFSKPFDSIFSAHDLLDLLKQILQLQGILKANKPTGLPENHPICSCRISPY
jgi:hypothetical protein